MGLRSDAIRKKLWNEADLTFKKEVDIATAVKTMAKDVIKTNRIKENVTSVNYIQERRTKTIKDNI